MNIEFLKQLLAIPSPSSEEAAAARLWRNEAESFADKVYADVRGSSFAVLEHGAPRILLAGHIDEIGLMISYIDDDGFVYFAPIGGWDSQVLVGQRVRLVGRSGEVVGVIGKKAIHLMKPDERDRVSKIEDLWIDIGVKSREEALEHLRIGSVGVVDGQVYELPHGRIVSHGIDNRIGAFTVLEALRLLAENRPAATVAASATSQEEISFAGAYAASYGFDPLAAIIVDVTHATDSPGSDKRRQGDIRLGGGPVLDRGSAVSPVVFEMLVETAEREGIPYAVAASPGGTGTDADAINRTRGGIACGLVSIPNRYMHSPSEMVALEDVENAARLIAAFVRSVNAETDFVPR